MYLQKDTGSLSEHNHGVYYRIRVSGRLDKERWSDWFASMDIHPDADGNTVLSGWLADQSSLYGLLARLRDLGLSLLEVVQGE
ncbi:MAG: hypothetical protein SF123_22520 [Chloroflexota bacterium]|nr:hypothetical protein [Chloroflexota bacterium]